MKNDMMKAIPGSLDHDLVFEAVDVMIDEAGIMNGQAFIQGRHLLEHKSNLSQWPYPHLSNSSSRLIIYLTPRDPHVALAMCDPVHCGVVWYAYIIHILFSRLCEVGPASPFQRSSSAIVTVHACTSGAVVAGIFRSIV